MNHSKPTDQFERIRTLLVSKFHEPRNGFNDKSIKEALESPFIKDHIFSGNLVAIVDHSINSYRYMSESSRDIFGFSPDVFLDKGLAFTFSMINPEDIPYITNALERASAAIVQLPPELRIHVRLNYSLRYNALQGMRTLFQQTRPLALNDAGLPYLVLALVSDITEYVSNANTTCSLVLHQPDEFPKTLLSLHSAKLSSPLTSRETQIVIRMAEGLDAGDIASSLFISEGTVRTHRKNILEKTGAKNSVHLVRMAMANGWI